MFEAWTLGIGLVITIVLALLKFAAVVTFGWLGVWIPFIVAAVLVLIKWGVDVGDFLPD